MKIQHTGIAPQFPLVFDDSTEKKKNQQWFEFFPDGTYRIWNKRTLVPGCQRWLTNPEEQDNLLFCDYCQQWFHRDHYKTGEGYAT